RDRGRLRRRLRLGLRLFPAEAVEQIHHVAAKRKTRLRPLGKNLRRLAGRKILGRVGLFLARHSGHRSTLQRQRQSQNQHLRQLLHRLAICQGATVLSPAVSVVFLVLSAFLASAVEMVEALTIVLASGLARGWRSSLAGLGAAVVVLAGLVA